jgi:lysophospholipase L1-like esterase
MERAKVILIGDSITQRGIQVSTNGWGALLAEYYEGKADVINRGFSGYTSTLILPIVKQISEQEFRKPVLFVLCIGANDASSEEWCQHVSVSEFESNVLECVQMLKKRSPHVVLVPPPPINEVKWDSYSSQFNNNNNSKGFRNLERTRLYAQAVKKIALEQMVHFVDLWKNETDWLQENDPLLSDGLHLSSRGNRYFYDAVLQCIESNVPEFDASKLALSSPDWKICFGIIPSKGG